MLLKLLIFFFSVFHFDALSLNLNVDIKLLKTWFEWLYLGRIE